MAKIYGLFGSMTGKLADTVMSVRNGEQIARKYQPIVYNPSTPAQVETRAKLKMLSQISAVLGPAIAMRRVGSVSGRNFFTKKNFPLAQYATDTATIDMTAVQLTNSVVGLPGLSVTRTASTLTMALNAPATTLDRVVYVEVTKGTDGKLRLFDSYVVQKSGDPTFGKTSQNLPLSSDELYVLAYGIRDNTDAARVIFGNLESESAAVVAKLVTSSNLLEQDVTLTETKGIFVPTEAE